MDEREELKQELEQELQWIQYRQKMRQLAERAKQGNLTTRELESLNTRLNDLAAQIKALDSESRRIEDERILE